jgi:hypothetical protein
VEDVSNLVFNPPPRFSILPSSNSSAISPWAVETLEITIKSLANIPSIVTLSIGPTHYLDVIKIRSYLSVAFIIYGQTYECVLETENQIRF